MVKKRSWREPAVRFWWLSSIVLLLIGLWFVLQQAREYQVERQLTNNPAIPATITDIAGTSRHGARFTPGNPCTLSFTLNGQTTLVTGNLEQTTDYISPGQTVMIHVNPANPTEWTDRDRPVPILRRSVAGFLIVPLGLIAWIGAVWQRRRILNNWRQSPALAYSVVEWRYTALAPLSRAVRCVDAAGRDKKLVTVFLPSRHAQPNPNDVLWLIHPAGDARLAIAAAAYES
jgi:hypothetical protein